MGIDINLKVPEQNPRFKELQATKKEWLASLTLTMSPPEQEQLEVYHGSVDYIRSAYNSNGLFVVLEEVFGFDVLAYLFPGDWKTPAPSDPNVRGTFISGGEFVEKVATLLEIVKLARSRENLALPWTNEFTEVTHGRIPDSVSPVDIESMSNDCHSLTGSAPRERAGFFNLNHIWPVTNGLIELRLFGLAAKTLGEKAFVQIST